MKSAGFSGCHFEQPAGIFLWPNVNAFISGICVLSLLISASISENSLNFTRSYLQRYLFRTASMNKAARRRSPLLDVQTGDPMCKYSYT